VVVADKRTAVAVDVAKVSIHPTFNDDVAVLDVVIVNPEAPPFNVTSPVESVIRKEGGYRLTITRKCFVMSFLKTKLKHLKML